MREFAGPCLAKLTTLHLGGRARALLMPENEEDLSHLGIRAAQLDARLYPIGHGSNLLARDGELPLALVRLDLFNAINVVERDGEAVYVRAGAGVPLRRLLRFCLARGLTGLEGLVGIPGSVGGACAMNAGSFGVETGAKIYELQAFDGDKMHSIQASGLRIGHRYLEIENCKIFPLVTSVIFALTSDRKYDIFQRMNLNYLEKKSRQPVHAWSAGCAFKNPPDAPSAGKLLEDAGFRGKTHGGMGFSPKHANFLVNTGNGTSSQALELLEQARNEVFEKYGIKLELEIRIIPCP